MFCHMSMTVGRARDTTDTTDAGESRARRGRRERRGLARLAPGVSRPPICSPFDSINIYYIMRWDLGIVANI